MSNHTKGPWLIEYNNDTGPNDDFFVEWLEVGPARVYCDRGEVLDPVAMANAKLIAAAPDLLAALEDMLAGWKYIRESHGDLYGVGWDRAQDKATAAIARARGAK